MLVSKKFYQTKEFKRLNHKWRSILEISGFEDLEDAKQNLKTYDRRTQSFDSRDDILNLYSAIATFLSNTLDIPPKHRTLLELYMDNVKVKAISTRLDMSLRWCWKWLKHYKRLFLYKK